MVQAEKYQLGHRSTLGSAGIACPILHSFPYTNEASMDTRQSFQNAPVQHYINRIQNSIDEVQNRSDRVWLKFVIEPV